MLYNRYFLLSLLAALFFVGLEANESIQNDTSTFEFSNSGSTGLIDENDIENPVEAIRLIQSKESTPYSQIFSFLSTSESRDGITNSSYTIANPLLYVPNDKEVRVSILSKGKIVIDDSKSSFIKISSIGKYTNGQKLRKIIIDSEELKSFLASQSVDIKDVSIKLDFSKLRNVPITNDRIPAANTSIADQISQLPYASKKNFDTKQNSDNRIRVESGSALQFNISETGLYRITASELRSSGFDLDDSRLDYLILMGTGGKDLSLVVDMDKINSMYRQPLIINRENGKLKDITFLGMGPYGFEGASSNSIPYEHYLNTFSKTNSYVLAYSEQPLSPIDIITPPAGESVHIPTSYTHREFHENDIVNAYDYGGGRDFIGEIINSPKIFTDNVYNITDNSEIEYIFSLAHRNNASGENGNGFFDITMNGEKYPLNLSLSSTSYVYTSYQRRKRSHKLSSSSVINGKSNIQFGYSPNSVQGIGYLDYYQLNYVRSMTAIDNSVVVFADHKLTGITEFNVDGFDTSSEKYIYDITDPSKPLPLQNLSNTANRVVFKDNLNRDRKIYYASCDFKKPTSQIVELNGLSQLDLTDIDMVMLTHSNLMESAIDYAEYREAQSGLNIQIIDVQDIYNEFGGGVDDVVTIRNFLAYHYNNMDKPFEYLLIWGHGHYDFRDINFDIVNLVPTYQSFERDSQDVNEVDNVSSDDLFTDMNATDKSFVPSFASGRIPIRNNEQGAAYLRKIQHYENGSDGGNWRQRVLLTADDSFTDGGPGDGARHINESESLAEEILAPSIYQNKVYLAEFEHFLVGDNRRGRKGARETLLDYLNRQSSVLVNWTGHGNPGVWAHEGFFIVETDVPALRNKDRLPYIIAATCDFSRFDHPVNSSGGEKIVLSENGGSIAIFAATRLVTVSANNRLARSLFNFQTSVASNGKYPTIGEAAMLAKMDNVGNNTAKYFLFGDPSMRILLPENKVSISSINQEATYSKDTFNLKGMQEIDIEGTITNDAGILLSDFNGYATIVIHDGDTELQATDLDNRTYNYTEYGGALNRITVPVVNGNYAGSFFLPKDIAYSDNHGRIFLYAEEENGDRTAKGNFNRFYINGLDDVSSISDNEGPIINMYMDHPDFNSCDEVAPNTTLYVELRDESGINATGVGIGHNLEAWIGTSTDRIDLSRNYETSLEDSKSGMTYANLEDIEPGQYTITVRAWDLFNNFSVQSTCFTVSHDGDRISLNSTDNYPNPFTEQTTIRLKHRLPVPFDVQVNISDVTGVRIDSFRATVSDTYNGDILWNPNQRGLNLNTGNYFYTIESLGTDISNPDDDNIVFGKIMYVNP